MELNQQIEFYNNYWSSLNKFGSYKLKRISEIISLLDFVNKSNKNSKILDLGCGDGRCCAIWNEIGETSGIDLSTSAMKNARERYPFINFQSGNATNTSHNDNSFDIIISQEVIEHIAVQSEYIDECSRLLRGNGFLILTTPNRYYFDRRIGGNYSNQPIENIVTARELKKKLKRKFKILKLYTIIHPSGDKGIYSITSNRLFNYFIAALKAKKLEDYILSIMNLGLNTIVLAQNK